MDDLAVDVGQAKVAAGVAIDQPGVVDSHQVQDRRVVVVDVHRIGDDVDAELVGLAEGESPLHARPGQQRRERLGIMVAALGVGAVGPGGPAEFGADGHQGLVEQPALL